MKVIGIDLDDTCINTFEVIKRYFNVYYPEVDADTPEESPWDIERKLLCKYKDEIDDKLEVYPGVYEALDYLKENGYKTVLITSRGEEVPGYIDHTKEFLERKKLFFDKMIFSAKDKGEICVNEGVDLFIDDHDHNIDVVAARGVEVLKYGDVCDTHPYALSWKEVLEYIKKGV